MRSVLRKRPYAQSSIPSPLTEQVHDEGRAGRCLRCGTKRSFSGGDPSERVGVIEHETNLINFKFSRECPEQTFIPIAAIRRQAGIALLCPPRPLRQGNHA